MRRIVFPILAISSISFSFQKLEFREIENIYAMARKSNGQAEILASIPQCCDPSRRFYLTTSPLERNLVQLHYKYIHFGRYDSMEDLEHVTRQDSKDPVVDFLKCNFNYDFNTFWEIDNLKQYESITSGRCIGPLLFGISSQGDSRKWEVINRSLNDPNNITFYSQDTAEKYPLYYHSDRLRIYNTNFFLFNDRPITTVRLRKEYDISFTQFSVLHQNNKIILRKKDSSGKILQEIELQPTLLNYYKPSEAYSNLAQKIAVDKNKYSNLSEISGSTVYAARKVHYKPFPEEQYQLLKDSQILTLWGVFQNTDSFFYKKNQKEKNVPSSGILVGLAQNMKTKELFHWVIDLKKDINVLFGGLIAADRHFKDQNIETYKNIPYSLNTKNKGSSYWIENDKLPDNYMIDSSILRVVQFKTSSLYCLKRTQLMPNSVYNKPFCDISILNWCILSDALNEGAPLNSNDIHELKTPFKEPMESREGFIYWKKFWRSIDNPNYDIYGDKPLVCDFF